MTCSSAKPITYNASDIIIRLSWKQNSTVILEEVCFFTMFAQKTEIGNMIASYCCYIVVEGRPWRTILGHGGPRSPSPKGSNPNFVADCHVPDVGKGATFFLAALSQDMAHTPDS